MKRITVTITDEIQASLEAVMREVEDLGVSIGISDAVRAAVIRGLKEMGKMDRDYKL